MKFCNSRYDTSYLCNRTNKANYICKVFEEYKKLNVETYHANIREHIERKYEIDFAMLRLPNRQKEVLRLTNIEGLSIKAAAIRLGISYITVETIKAQAYKNLYEILVNDKSISYNGETNSYPTTCNVVKFDAYIQKLNICYEIAKKNNDNSIMDMIEKTNKRIESIVDSIEDRRAKIILKELLKHKSYAEIAKTINMSGSQTHAIRRKYLTASIEEIKKQIKTLIDEIGINTAYNK